MIPSGIAKVSSVRDLAGWSVVVVRDAEALAEHVPAWDALAAAALEPNVFYESWMLLPAVRAFGGGADFRFVLVFGPHPTNPTGPGVLGGFFPLVRRRRYKGLPAVILSLWQYRYGLLGTPLIRADAPQPCLEAFFHWLPTGAANGPLMEFASVSADGPFYRELIHYLRDRRPTNLVMDTSTRALFRRGRDSDAFLQAALSGENRKALRRKAKRLAEAGAVEYKLLVAGDDLEPWLTEFLQVEGSGWKGRAGTALASSPADRVFFETAARAAYRRGRLGLLILTVSGRPIAVQCFFLAGQGAFAFKTGYDEAWAHCSPGILLQTELIHRLHARTELQWMDSNSEPEGYLNQLWPDRRIIQTLLVATGKTPGDLLVSLVPFLKWLKRKLLGMSRPWAPTRLATHDND
jgi:hypothetical protein